MLQHEYSLTGATYCWWHLPRFQIEFICLDQKSVLLHPSLCFSARFLNWGEKILNISARWSTMSTREPPYPPQYLMAWAILSDKKCNLLLTKLEPHLVFPISKQHRPTLECWVSSTGPPADSLEVHPCHPERERSNSSSLCTYIKMNHSLCNQ